MPVSSRIIVFVLAAGLMGACQPDRDKVNNPDSPNPPPDEGDYTASAQVSTTASGSVRTTSGAGIQVPIYAVPRLTDGGEGRMIFSIERDQTITPEPPQGVSRTSDVYRFGPEGFTFGEMVKVTVPFAGARSGRPLMLYRINQTTGRSEPYGGIVDSVAGTVSAMTYKLSPWYVGSSSVPNTAYGAFRVTNLSTNYWLNLCVVEYELKYPDADVNFTGDANSAWAPVGDIGWTNSGLWHLPQGRYRFCVDMNTVGTLMNPPGPPSRTMTDWFSLDEPWTAEHPVVAELPPYAGPGPDWQQAPCDCVPIPTVPVGTGQVQVTLTWHSAQSMDLDLWVTEPGGERCYFAHDVTATGGTLDRDNACGNYEDGRPENIFWSTAVAGEYKVEVDWFSACGHSISTMPFDVRVVNGANARTYTMSCPDNGTVEVCRFTVHSPAAGRMSSSSPDALGPAGALLEGSEDFGRPIGAVRFHPQRPEKP